MECVLCGPTLKVKESLLAELVNKKALDTHKTGFRECFSLIIYLFIIIIKIYTKIKQKQLRSCKQQMLCCC